VREWSLEGRKKKKKTPAVFTCKVCFGTFAKPFRYCPECGAIVIGWNTSRAAPERVDGELQEMNADLLAKSRYGKPRKKTDPARRRARTLEELVRYAISQGYASAERWAMHIYTARQAKTRARG
jgi:hypothetical protein